MSEAADKPRVAIVILNWNGGEDVLSCVSTLPRQTYPNYEPRESWRRLLRGFYHGVTGDLALRELGFDSHHGTRGRARA